MSSVIESRLRAAGFCPLAVVLALIAGWCTGCTTAASRDRRLTEKPNMEFSESLVFRNQNRLFPQVEPGYALSGGAQSAGASCCK